VALVRARTPSALSAWATLILGAALAAAGLLVAAALLSFDDPAVAGEATLARLAGSVADSVVSEWERLRRDPAPFAGEDCLRWAAAPPTEPQAALDLPSPPDPIADALLGEAGRLAANEETLERALEALAVGLARTTDQPRRAEFELRTIQLARALGRNELAEERWRLVFDELDPLLARNGTSVLLLATLAAAPALTPEQRALARTRLGRLWAAGALALPREDPPSDPARWVEALREPAPLRSELRRRLQQLVPDGPEDPDLAATLLADRARWIEALFGPLDPPADALGALARAPGGELLHRRAVAGLCEGVLLPPGEVEGRLWRALHENDLLPPAFTLDLTGDDARAGPIVRARTELPGSPFGFVLRHAQPASIQSAIGRRQAWTRAAFLVLALAIAAAGVATFRALRREQRLAALRSAFVASVSHELRTPIASILLLAENLERGRVEGEAARARYHGLIRREAERLRALVDDVLDVARLERGEPAPRPLEELGAEELALELEAAARERVAAAGGTLEFHCPGLPPRLWLEREAVRRALLNLVENALRHSGSRDLDLACVGDGAGGVVIRLRDHGRGVPEGERERIFRPFERLERPGAAPGTGLGLAIVRAVAERHGGRALALAPEEGPGAVFELHLPRVRGEDGA
jgi:signal transduction histidine kinase